MLRVCAGWNSPGVPECVLGLLREMILLLSPYGVFGPAKVWCAREWWGAVFRLLEPLPLVFWLWPAVLEVWSLRRG